MEKRVTRPRTPKPTSTQEPRKSTSHKTANTAFIELQIKSEKTVSKLLDWFSKKSEEQSLNLQTKDTGIVFLSVIETLGSVGLLSPDRLELAEQKPDIELDPIIPPENKVDEIK
jgi:hypothetical protein